MGGLSVSAFGYPTRAGALGVRRVVAAPEGEKATQAGREECAARDRRERPNDSADTYSSAHIFGFPSMGSRNASRQSGGNDVRIETERRALCKNYHSGRGR